jgi:hypothetical protein
MVHVVSIQDISLACRISHEEITEKSSGETSLTNGTLADPGMWPLRMPGRGSCISEANRKHHHKLKHAPGVFHTML